MNADAPHPAVSAATAVTRRSALALIGGAMLAGTTGVTRGDHLASEATELTLWRPANTPILQVTDLATESPRTWADFAGHPLIVNFWASWCAPCRLEMPALNALARRLAPNGLQFLAINHGEMPERVRRFVTEVPIEGIVLLDRSQTQLKAWGGQALPTTFLFDAQGKPRMWAHGERDWNHPDVVKAVAALSEQPFGPRTHRG